MARTREEIETEVKRLRVKEAASLSGGAPRPGFQSRLNDVRARIAEVEAELADNGGD